MTDYVTPEEAHKREYTIYRQIAGLYKGVLDTGDDKLVQESTWTKVESLIKEMGPKYSMYDFTKITKRSENRMWKTDFLPSTKSLLEKIAADYDFYEPDRILNEYSNNGGGISLIQNANLTSNQTMNTSQIVQSLENQLGEGQLEQIKPAIDDYEENPGKWVNVQKLVNKLLDLGVAYAPTVIDLLNTYLPKK